MRNAPAGIRISKKAFLTSFFVLLALMAAAGALGLLVPSGSYDRVAGSDGLSIVADSYHTIEKTAYPVWRWLTAPVEVLFSEDGLQAIVIILFIMIVGGSFAVLDAAKALKEAVARIAAKFSSRKYLLLAAVTLFFMGIGALLGIFEETIPLVPVAIALAASLGWDLYVGLGMSILATGFGFSAAIANPFSIGTAQRLSGLPLFSGAGFRVLVFLAVFALYFLWLAAQARKADRRTGIGQAGEGEAKSAASPVAAGGGTKADSEPSHPERGALFFGISTAALIIVILVVSLTRSLADYSMPIIALVFLVSGFGSGLVSGLKPRRCLSAFASGVGGILPGVLLILMAMAVKHIIISGGIMDTILHAAASFIGGSSGYGAAALIYLFVLGMNFFIGSATAKAFLLMPLLAPLADLAGLSRQIAVQAFAFGDGFSNMIYPTNAVLLIALGVAGISWPAWFRRTWALQAATLCLTMGLLMLAVLLGYS
jgi:uncharacterized ion transporter superfamily protein YfcC